MKILRHFQLFHFHSLTEEKVFIWFCCNVISFQNLNADSFFKSCSLRRHERVVLLYLAALMFVIGLKGVKGIRVWKKQTAGRWGWGMVGYHISSLIPDISSSLFQAIFFYPLMVPRAGKSIRGWQVGRMAGTWLLHIGKLVSTWCKAYTRTHR